MPRAGMGGGGSSSSHSSSGHSPSHTTSGHISVSDVTEKRSLGSSHSSSRPSSHSRPSSPRYSPPPPPRYHRYHSPRRTTVYVNNGYGYEYGRRASTSATIISVVIVIILICAAIFMVYNPPQSTPSSTVNREKLNLGISFDSDCVIDEIGWFDHESTAGRRLEHFFNKTGIQPFIYLKAYDPSLNTESEKTEFAEQWYTDNIDNEATFLYVYFAEEDPDEVGYMTVVNGKQIAPVMDGEAIDIFWSYIDNTWYEDVSTDEMFERAFTRTADNIMKQHTNGWSVLRTIIIIAAIAGVIVVVIYIIKLRRKHEAERAEETKRILETPLSGTADELADKYTDKTDSQ